MARIPKILCCDARIWLTNLIAIEIVLSILSILLFSDLINDGKDFINSRYEEIRIISVVVIILNGVGILVGLITIIGAWKAVQCIRWFSFFLNTIYLLLIGAGYALFMIALIKVKINGTIMLEEFIVGIFVATAIIISQIFVVIGIYLSKNYTQQKGRERYISSVQAISHH
ncbi:hypothetical protein WR25_04302 [Diploscapter pachys]|uniref:Uncharacterized protein n=1 Tax=Diploscapter pachys TaxID=2018661 RepID=A0A2A2LEV5_9BILA|nr:hypothetical protein WR25_04302 [Diploscapter pachys]